MGKYHSILLMLFNIAFLMKCKYFMFRMSRDRQCWIHSVNLIAFSSVD